MRLGAVLIALCVSASAGVAFVAAGESELVYQSVYSDALKNNLLGDPAYRSVIVYSSARVSRERNAVPGGLSSPMAMTTPVRSGEMVSSRDSTFRL